MEQKIVKKRISRKKIAQEKAQKWLDNLNTNPEKFLIEILENTNKGEFFEKIDEIYNGMAPMYIAVLEYCIARYRDPKYPKASGINFLVSICHQCKKLFLGDSKYCTSECSKLSRRKNKIDKLREELEQLEKLNEGQSSFLQNKVLNNECVIQTEGTIVFDT